MLNTKHVRWALAIWAAVTFVTYARLVFYPIYNWLHRRWLGG